jgi:alpha-methylacyl-CoA racemase
MTALRGVRVVELAAVGPVPFATMVLADLGAEVVRVDRPAGTDPYVGAPGAGGPLARGRRSVRIDLREDDGVAVLRRLTDGADVLLEGLRPGVAERLGVGPDDVCQRNPALVYGRMTGYGQTGPLAPAAGHDITYLAYSGVLHGIGRPSEPPVPPMNLVADFGGGAMSLVVGVLAALLERHRSGRGQVVDVAMVDAAAYLATMTRHLLAVGAWQDDRGVNLLDGGAPHYRCYRTRDHRFVAVGALEPAFWSQLLEVLGLSQRDLPSPYHRDSWVALNAQLEATFLTRSRDEWVSAATGMDACLAPVLDWEEASAHLHPSVRGSYQTSAGVLAARPPMRLSRTDAAVAEDPAAPGADSVAVLADLGFDPGEIEGLMANGVVG